MAAIPNGGLLKINEPALANIELLRSLAEARVATPRLSTVDTYLDFRLAPLKRGNASGRFAAGPRFFPRHRKSTRPLIARSRRFPRFAHGVMALAYSDPRWSIARTWGLRARPSGNCPPPLRAGGARESVRSGEPGKSPALPVQGRRLAPPARRNSGAGPYSPSSDPRRIPSERLGGGRSLHARRLPSTCLSAPPYRTSQDATDRRGAAD